MKSAFLILMTLVAISCNQNAERNAERKTVRKAIGKVNTDGTVPPIVTPVSAASKLAVVATSKPFSLHPHLGKDAVATITPANGLPLGDYYDAMQDNTGNLWLLSASNKLIKYDGHNFVTYPIILEDNSEYEEMVIDKNDDLWMVVSKTDSTGITEVCTVYLFNGITFEKFSLVPKTTWVPLKDFLGTRLFEQPDGNIWIATDTPGQIMKFTDRQLVLTLTQNDFSFNRIVDIKTDKPGNTWFLDYADSALTRFDGKAFKKFTRKDGLPKVKSFNVLPVSADSIYLSAADGVYLFDGHRSIKIYDNFPASAVFDSQGTLWLQSSEEAGVISKISQPGVTTFKREDGLGVADSWSIGIDKQDNIWVLSQNSINRLYKPITTYGDIFPASGLRRGVRSFYVDRQDRYWFGSYFYGVSCYDGKVLTNYSFLNYDATGKYGTENNIGDLKQDQEGNIWIGTMRGSLVKFDGKNFMINNKSNGFLEDGLMDLTIDNKGNIWFPSVKDEEPNGVAYFNGREKVTFTTAQGLCNNNVHSIYESTSGTMWFGTENGLCRFKDGSFTSFTVADGLGNNIINVINEDKYGNLWLGTEDGVSRYDGNQFNNYTTDDGIVSNSIIRIKSDSTNDLLWLASSVGFTALKINANHPDSVIFETYSEAEGFPLKRARNFTVDPHGYIWISEGNNSITRFDYKKVKANSKPFKLHITDIRLNNEKICWSNLNHDQGDSMILRLEMQLRFNKSLDKDALALMADRFSDVSYDSLVPFDLIPQNLSLPYKANSISFDFSAIDPLLSKSTKYAYMLEGFDKTWSPMNSNTNANFGNLREGKYSFKVKALNPYGLWSEANYSFVVHPPWYRTWAAYTLYILLSASAVFLFIRWRTKALSQEKLLLEERVAARTSELKQSLEDLKSTQDQLIQSEKMASLGELTAGIAHEIQNPLNFVNNFSDLNKELLLEVKDEIAKGNLDEANSIASDVISNEEKINFHGKRADGIVKGMLQHSRSSTGTRELTDINALADEYLRLAFHGLRAKDKSFNATMKTDFDKTIGNINIVPQDIGRVILNLITNAFYTVNEKKKSGVENYEPTVSVITKKAGNRVMISVKDNGNGIPASIKDKILQPFFTTKPTGQGTGLGLSLSYDIVKAHGGELKIDSKEGEGSSFDIYL
ncbi:MAG: two-component regulator propeller domain-containing protein [Bacteroidota bacterium]